MAAPVQSAPLVAPTAEHHQALASLEEAATLFSNPDPALRSSGEAVFLQLRESHAAVEHALYALEQSHDPFVHFQCLSVLLDKLPTLGLTAPSASLPSLSVLRDFLLRLVTANTQLSLKWPNYTRARALQTFAAVQIRLLGIELEERRSTGQAGQVIEAHSHFIVVHIVQLISLPDQTSHDFGTQYSHFINGVGLAAALLDEIANAKSLVSYGGSGDESGKKVQQIKARSADHINLSPLQLRWVKSWVQEQVLPPLLQNVVHCLSSILVHQQQQQQHETLVDSLVSPLSALVNVSEKVLRWRPILSEPWAGLSGAQLSFDDTALLLSHDESSADFDDDDDAGGDEDDATGKPSKPTQSVRYIPDPLASAYLSCDMIALMASAYRLAARFDTSYNREAAVCLTKLRRCILAIAGFANTPGEDDDTVRAERQKAFLETLKMLQSDGSLASARLLTDRGAGLLFLAQTYCIVFETGNLRHAENGGYATESAAHDLAALSNDILAFAFGRRTDSDEEEDVALLADEAVSSILYAWLSFGQAADLGRRGLQVPTTYFPAIVMPFIDARLHAAAAGGIEPADGDEEELGEETQSDQEAYENTLVLLTSLARDGDLAACLAHLQTWSENVLHDMTAFYTTSSNGAIHVGPAELKVLERQWETLHWLLLITGHILSDASNGEVAEVPNEVHALANNDQQVALHLVRSLGVGLLQLFADAGPDKPQSPQVIQTLLWFNARLVPSYMMTVSTPILSAELNNDQGKQLLAQFVSLVEKMTGVWLADSDVIVQVSAVLRAFALSDGVMKVLLSLPQFTALVKAIVEGLGMLPAKTHNGLVSSLVGCVYASASTQAPQEFFERITSAIEQRLAAIVHQSNFTAPSVFQHAETVDALMNVLDMFEGMAASAQPRSAGAVFAFLSRFFDTLIDLAHMYKDRGEVGTAIVRIVRTLVGALDLGFSADEDTVRRLNEFVWRLLDGMPTVVLLGDGGNTALEEETPFEGLCLTLDMLNDLLLASDGDASSSLNEWLAPVSHRQTADVCLLGFARLVPVLQERDVLSVARVRTLLARLTSRLLLSFGHRLVGLVVYETLSTAAAARANSDDCGRLYAACVQALALSLGFDEMGAVADALHGCDALARAAKHVVAQAVPALKEHGGALCVANRTVAGALLSPLYETVLRMLLFEPLATSFVDALLSTHHQLLDAIVITSDVAWQADGGGQSHIQHHLDKFCASTPLVSLRTSTAAAWKKAGPSADEAQRRAALSQAVSQLVKIGVSMHSKQIPLDAKSKRQLQARARELAWNGRSEVRQR